MAGRPRQSPARKSQYPKPTAQDMILDGIREGRTVEEACRAAERSPETYRQWMKDEPDFNARVAEVRAGVKATLEESDGGRQPVPDFPEFCEKYLRQPLAPHHRRMWEVMMGGEPSAMHTAMKFLKGASEWEAKLPDLPAGRVIINVPPGHGKTTSLTVNLSVWLIHRQPDVKIIVISKDQELAKQILSEVQQKLESPLYADMHLRFGPADGWKDAQLPWAATRFYVAGRTEAFKDPTFQALGIGGRIYGARSDVIFLDDAVTLANVNEYDKQQRWLTQEVETRLDGQGLLAILGTRVGPRDLYSELREMEDWEGEKVFTYFSQPAVLDYGETDWHGWEPLWPERFPAKRLQQLRRNDQQWALVYQQEDVAEDATFNPEAVRCSINRERFPGPMTAAGMGHRPGGMEGLYVIGGLDPATVGKTAMVVVGLDRSNGKRYVLDGLNQGNMHAEKLISEVQRLTETYGIHEWIIERNAAQRFITQIPQIGAWLRQRGVRVPDHNTTGTNKWDPDFGIQAMAELFNSCGTPPEMNRTGAWSRRVWAPEHPAWGLIELPNPKQNKWVAELIDELNTWQPSGMTRSQKTDLVMALWFTEIASRRLLGHGRKVPTHMENKWLSPARRSAQKVINLGERREALMAEASA